MLTRFIDGASFLHDGATDVQVRRTDAETSESRGSSAKLSPLGIVVTASDDSTDRYGDRIAVDGYIAGRRFGDGWQTKDFEKNPVFLPFHQYDRMPLGTVRRLWKETAGARKRLRAHVQFQDSEEGRLFYSAYKSGTLRAVSVGFRPIEFYEPTSSDERKRLKLGERGVIHGTSELYELSAVSIPANPNALMQGVCQDEKCSLVKFVPRLEALDRELGYQVHSAWRLGPRRATFDLGGRRQADPKLERKWERIEETMRDMMAMTRAAGMTTRDWRTRR